MQKAIPCAVTIAGSDSGGGAGIQADLKAFAAHGVHGASVVTCLTAQNPQEVLGIEPCSPRVLRLQLEAVFNGLRPAAAKIGMLYSAASVNVVASFLKNRELPLVVDPVLVSTSGTPLLQSAGVRALCEKLLPMASVIMPNLHEAGILAGETPNSVQGMRQVARVLHQRFGCAVLVKGGHLRGLKEAVDIYYDSKQELLLRAPYVRGVRTHGTGCTYSAAVTAWLARGLALPLSSTACERVCDASHRAQPQNGGTVGSWVPRPERFRFEAPALISGVDGNRLEVYWAGGCLFC
jgi:hydroxymethylpyrimidine/phosphomethylpyrimidine kinase